MVAGEYGQNGQDAAQYYRSQRDIVARKQFGLKGQINPGQENTLPMAGGLKYYHPDLRGSVSALTDPKGQMVEQYRYDAFGGLFTGITAPYNTSGLNGHEFDPASGLVDMKARWYAPQNGRFLTPDTWRGTLEEPWTQNRYAYTGNNPVTRWDPSGNMPCDLGQSCAESLLNGVITYSFLGSRDGGDTYKLVDTWTNLKGTYRTYSGSTTTYYDYLITAVTWIPPLVVATHATYSRDVPGSYTTLKEHTQDSLNEYTEEYREARTGPMPEERIISSETCAAKEYLLSGATGEWVELVRGPVASAGSQVVAQAVAQASGEPYVVRAGDSLWSIAEMAYRDGGLWQEIVGANPQLQDPGMIYAGQVLLLPGSPVIPHQADYSGVQQGEYLDALDNLDFTAFPATLQAHASVTQDTSQTSWMDNAKRHPLADIPTTISNPQTSAPLMLPESKGKALGIQGNVQGNFWFLSGQLQVALVAHENGPWYDRVGLVVSTGGGFVGGNRAWYDGIWQKDVVTGNGSGLGGGAAAGIIAFGNLGSLHDLAGSGRSMGGFAYAGLGGALDYIAPAPDTPDPYTGFDVGIGAGLGAGATGQASETIVLTPGSVIRWWDNLTAGFEEMLGVD